MVYSPNGQPVDAFVDSCQDLALQPEHQEEQQGMEQLLSDPGVPAMQQQPCSEQQLVGIPEEQQQQQQPSEGLKGLAEDLQDCLSNKGPTLVDVCSLPECWGLLSLDLMTGEAALHESGACKVHVRPGKTRACATPPACPYHAAGDVCRSQQCTA